MGVDIKRIRKKYGLTQVQLAEMLGVTQPRISRLEKQDTITLELLEKIAKALNVSVKDIIENNK